MVPLLALVLFVTPTQAYVSFPTKSGIVQWSLTAMRGDGRYYIRNKMHNETANLKTFPRNSANGRKLDAILSLQEDILASEQRNKSLCVLRTDNGSNVTTSIYIPDTRQIIQFAIPAVGVWLCSPLLSLIDTSTVGLLAGTAQQAALNPATAVTDYSARLLSYLYTGATNMMALSHDKDRQSSNKSITASTFLSALQLSLISGTVLAVAILVSARPLLLGIIGKSSSNREVMGAALRYVRIRALGMPAAALIGTAQASCLGMKDVQSPLYVVAVAGALNLLLDLALVGQPHVWIGGAAGAAWATIASQYFAAYYFLRHLGANESSATGSRGILGSRFTLISLCQKPATNIWRDFKPYFLPVTATQIGRCSTYVAMGHVVSSSLDIASMAANQIITSIFYTLIPIADSLGLTAQSFLPTILMQSTTKEKSVAGKLFLVNLLKVASIFGLFLAGVVAFIPMTSRFFTADAVVIALVRKIVPVLFIIFSLHGIFCASEGVLLAHKDLGFLGRMYMLYFAAVPYLMLRVKSSARQGRAVDLCTVWQIFLGYQLFRIATWVGRVAILQRKFAKKFDF